MPAIYLTLVFLLASITGCVAAAPPKPNECATLQQEVVVFAACKDIGCYPTYSETLWLERKIGRCKEALGASPRS
jgi:hypothetical protein